MKNTLKSLVSITILIILFGCSKNDDCVDYEKRENYLVEKITRFESSSNYTNTDFIYDTNNKLLKKVTTGKFVENNQLRDLKYIDEFEYNNGLVSKIHIKDLTHFMFSHDIHLFYNTNNQIIRQETWKNNIVISHHKFHYLNNKMVSIYSDDTEPFQTNTIYYDNLGNAFKHTYLVPKTSDLIGTPIPGEFIEQHLTFEYDNQLKPNIGLDYLFVYSLFQNSETEFHRQLSNNNLTKYNNSGSTWTYKYNELGLPITYELKWEGIQTLQPMIWNISYKKTH